MDEPRAKRILEQLAEDPLYLPAHEELLWPRATQTSALLYVGLFVFFIVSQLDGMKSIGGIAMLVAVLLVHEGGHAAGMRFFGYRDVRMFFIPFFGAAVQGRPAGVAAWKDALVSLLGPVPGVLLGVGLMALAFPRHPSRWLFELVQLLLLLNLFNLLPFGGLDGGRFLQRVIFSRHRVLDVAFQALGSLALGWLAFSMGMWALLLFVSLGVGQLPYRWRVLGGAAALRRVWAQFPTDPEQLDAQQAATLYGQAHRVLPGGAARTPQRLAEAMRSILDATRPPPSVLASLVLLLGYLVAAVVGGGTAALVLSNGAAPSWHTVTGEGFRVELPATALHPFESVTTPDGPLLQRELRATVRGVERFTVGDLDASHPIADREPWIDAVRDQIVRNTGLALAAERTLDVAGSRVREAHLAGPGRILRVRFFVAGSHLYSAAASAPEWGEDQDRFFGSFVLTAPAAAPAGGASPAR